MRRNVILAAAVVTGLSACSQTSVGGMWPGNGSPDEQAAAASPASKAWKNPVPLPDRSLKRPPLRTDPRLASRGKRPAPGKEKPPAAAFHSYDGVPAAVPETAQDRARRNLVVAKRKLDRDKIRVPKRDIVDVGLDRDRARPKPKRAQKPWIKSAPPPPRRPVAKAPEPADRPTVMASREPVQVQPSAAPPPSPVLAAPKAPTLRNPVARLDDTPPDIPTDSVSPTLPVNTVPASLGAANIQVREAAPFSSDGLEQSSAGEAGEISWAEASALMRAGEVGDFADLGSGQLMVTLCSGRGVLTTMPTENALLDVEIPNVICGIDVSQ